MLIWGGGDFIEEISRCCTYKMSHQSLPPLGSGKTKHSGAGRSGSFPVCDIANPEELMLPEVAAEVKNSYFSRNYVAWWLLALGGRP